MIVECPNCRQALRAAVQHSTPVTVRCRICGTVFSTDEALAFADESTGEDPTAPDETVANSSAAVDGAAPTGSSGTGSDAGGWQPVVSPRRLAQQTATGRARAQTASVGMVVFIVLASFLIRGGMRAARHFGQQDRQPVQPRAFEFDEQQRAAIQRMLEDAQERRRELEGRPRAKPDPSKSSPPAEEPPAAESTPPVDEPKSDR